MPRHQKAQAAPDVEADSLPDLTEKQRNFLHGLLAGKTAADAYRAAYDVADCSDRTIWAEASRLRHNPAVAAWLSAARRAGARGAGYTLEQHLRDLEELAEEARSTGNYGAAVAATNYMGKASGLYVERTQDVTQRGTLAELIAGVVEAVVGDEAVRALFVSELKRRAPDLGAALELGSLQHDHAHVGAGTGH